MAIQKMAASVYFEKTDVELELKRRGEEIGEGNRQYESIELINTSVEGSFSIRATDERSENELELQLCINTYHVPGNDGEKYHTTMEIWLDIEEAKNLHDSLALLIRVVESNA